MYGLFTLVITATYFYLPHHIFFLRQRATYYLLGLAPDAGSAGSVAPASASAPLGAGVVEGVGKWVGSLRSAASEL